MHPVLFVGPSLAGVDSAVLAGLTRRPPVKRGDIRNLIQEIDGAGVLIVADGTFHSFPSVGHAELREAIERGWTVWGVSSMGAIRAAEMHSFGMLGYGRIFERFLRDPHFTDDEVALLHAADEPYTPLSEPLIHIRLFLDAMLEQRRVSEKQQRRVLTVLESLWFGQRSLSLLAQLLSEHTRLSSDEVDAELGSFQQYRAKSDDLEALLKVRPWDK